MAPTADDKHTVLLIHGTFAHAEEDEGPAWWQRGSRPWEAIRTRLPEHAALVEQGRLFRWKSPNSERARRAAALDLLAEMSRLEDAGRPYHLIGHSHGGRVIWGAILEAQRRGRRLEHLVTWTTVGTPFLHLAPRRSSGFYEWVLLLGSLVTFGLLFGMFYIAMRALAVDRSAWTFIAVMIDLTFSMIAAFSVFHYLFIPFREAGELEGEDALASAAMVAFGDRWLGLWSPDDEAINGLRATLEVDLPLGRAGSSVPDPVFPSDEILTKSLASLVFKARVGAFNVASPIVGSRLRDSVRAYLQGNDRPYSVVRRVSVSPAASLPDSACLPLPDEINLRLVRAADEAARDAVPVMRAALGLVALGTDLSLAVPSLTGRELVHTSYFDDPGVIDILAIHIARSEGREAGPAGGAHQAHDDWVERWKRSVREGMAPPDRR